MNKEIIILGGGPTGIAAAYRLSEKGHKVVILEKENYFGGLSATLKKDDFLYELGPHAFHLKDPNITALLKKILKKDFRIIDTYTQVLIDRKLFEYPLKGGELIKKINPILGSKIIFGYIVAFIKNFFQQKDYQSFEDWGLSNFGPTLYKISFGDYTQKVWGMSPKLLSGKLAKQKLSRLNLGDIILKMLGFKGQEQPTYFKKYLYPLSGSQVILDRMLERIVQNGGRLISNSRVTKIALKGGLVNSIEYLDKYKETKVFHQSSIISTITLYDLVGLINSPIVQKSKVTSKNLKYRDMIIIYLLSKEENLPDSQWIYLVENRFKFNRITFGKNLSPKFGPKNGSILALEICCQKGDNLWGKPDEKILQLAKKDLDTFGLNPDKISKYFVKRIENAYPIYLKNFEKDLNLVLENLSQINNLISTGRNGFFLNSDIHDCFLMGFEAADSILKENSVHYYQRAKQKWLNFN